MNARVVCYLLFEYYTLKPTPLQEVEPSSCVFLERGNAFFFLFLPHPERKILLLFTNFNVIPNLFEHKNIFWRTLVSKQHWTSLSFTVYTKTLKILSKYLPLCSTSLSYKSYNYPFNWCYIKALMSHLTSVRLL